jgi:hypothetical protein
MFRSLYRTDLKLVVMVTKITAMIVNLSRYILPQLNMGCLIVSITKRHCNDKR